MTVLQSQSSVKFRCLSLFAHALPRCVVGMLCDRSNIEIMHGETLICPNYNLSARWTYCFG